MRAIPIVFLVTILAACAAPHRPAPAAAACLDDESEAITIQDGTIRRDLTRALERLHTEGGTATLAAMHEQLDRTRCELELPPIRTEPITAAALHAQALASTVIVAKRYKCDRCPDWHLGTASGFFISADGAFVTSRHVVEDDADTAIAIMDANGDVHPVSEILAADRDADVAILRAAIDEPVTPLPLRPGVAIAEPVSVLSHPASTYWYFTTGMVSRRFEQRVRRRSRVELLDITADFARGSSGAPVLDACGNVVGLVRATRSIYYDEKDGQPHNLQMVLKHCSPAEGVLRLVD